MALDKLRTTWENLGEVDPLWAVLSDPRRRGGGWDLDEFMSTGSEPVSRVVEMLRAADLSLGERVLDFGCGVGRLTNALAEHASTVVGVDIASSMITRARKLNQNPERTSFVHYDGRSLPFDDNTFDSAVTLLVLQHARPAIQLASLLELQRVVRPGGALVVQVPSHPQPVLPMPRGAYRSRIEILSAPQAARPNERVVVRARVTNTSLFPWSRGNVLKLGNHWRGDHLPTVWDDGRVPIPPDVLPGVSVDLTMAVRTPPVPGSWELELDLVHENVTWWNDAGSEVTRRRIEIDEKASVPAAPAPDVATDDALQRNGETEDPGDSIEMHGLHVDFVKSLLEHCGAELVLAEEDDAAGSEWVSYTYVIKVAGLD
jgi:SAM-dependent methyltransferase